MEFGLSSWQERGHRISLTGPKYRNCSDLKKYFTAPSSDFIAEALRRKILEDSYQARAPKPLPQSLFHSLRICEPTFPSLTRNLRDQILK